MKHKADFRAVIAASRFTTEAHRKFFKAIIEAYQKSRELTPSEIAVCQIEDSLSNDLKSGMRQHEHGNDVKTISEQRRDFIAQKIAHEKREAEALQIREEIAALEFLLRDRQKRLSEIDGERGFVDRRSIELAEARERVRNRS